MGNYFKCKYVDDGQALNEIVEKDYCRDCLAKKKVLRECIMGARKFEVDELERYKQLLDEKLMLMIGYWSEKNPDIDRLSDFLKQYHAKRIAKSTATKRDRRLKKEKIVYEAFRWLLVDKKTRKDRKWLAGLSENRFAGMIKDEISGDLKMVGSDKISNETIIDILRKRDKEKFSWYP